jgi:hypothetical protein
MWFSLLVLIPLCAVVVAPSQASASTNSTTQAQVCQMSYPTVCHDGGPPAKQVALAGRNYTGWAYLELNHCPAQMACAAIYRGDTPSFRWNVGKVMGWSPSTIAGGWVYVYPFSGDWRWLYNASTGWHAVHNPRLELRG